MNSAIRFGVAASAILLASSASAAPLVINSMHSDPAVKKAFEAVLTKFKAENPDLQVTVNTVDHESYKVQLRTWLPNNPPDICTWFAGNRAKYFVDKGLVEPLSDIWKDVGGEFGEGATKAVSFNGKPYLMPTSYYHWGFYYRKDLFEKAGVTKAPATWTEFSDAVTKIKASGVTPITIGVKQAWPAGAWFDFLNMRVNGYDFHMKLLLGNESYTSPKVKAAFAPWATLAKQKAFPENAAAMTWQEAAALMWQGKAAMYLMGNFIAPEIPKELDGKVGFFGFPVVDPKVPLAQVAPMDVYFIPAKAKNKDAAKKFLRFFARKDIQGLYNEINVMIPPNHEAKAVDNPFVKAGVELLNNAKAVSQFYDRDADPEVAKVGMDAFVEFMMFPDKLDAVLAKIENTRKRVHKK